MAKIRPTLNSFVLRECVWENNLPFGKGSIEISVTPAGKITYKLGEKLVSLNLYLQVEQADSKGDSALNAVDTVSEDEHVDFRAALFGRARFKFPVESPDLIPDILNDGETRLDMVAVAMPLLMRHLRSVLDSAGLNFRAMPQTLDLPEGDLIDVEIEA